MESESEPARFFEIKKWNAVAIWSWNIQVRKLNRKEIKKKENKKT